jgi:hypothetical protein
MAGLVGSFVEEDLVHVPEFDMSGASASFSSNSSSSKTGGKLEGGGGGGENSGPGRGGRGEIELGIVVDALFRDGIPPRDTVRVGLPEPLPAPESWLHSEKVEL